MTLEQKFKKETGLDAYILNDLRGHIAIDTYVEWLEEKCNIPVVSGSYYWVKCFTDDKYEPTVAVDYYNNGTMYFKFLNGGLRECRLVEDYKELNYR